MSFRYAQVSQRVFNTPLMYDERKAAAFLHGLGSRIAGDTIVVTNAAGAVDHVAGANGRPLAGKVGNRMERRFAANNLLPFDMVGSVAIIPIEGTLVHKGGWVGSYSGETSYQGLQAQIALARQSKEVKGVAFETDSYGGEVNGGFETARDIARLSAEKPTISILTDFAYSAGYLLASQARSVIMPRFGGAGSIGVIMIHADYSQALENEGIRLTIIRAGKKKADGNPYEALPDAVATRWQAMADAMRLEFAQTVATGRRGRITKAKALATEADVYNASEALSLGLVDAIADPLEAFEAFVNEVNRS
ncbi:S49 family peptidase [Rhizobium sp. FKY42]|uniref:S49 family peptidase n=1 Tax=Rhizobium sp. FKY42 TaxID=2562310 RepID=UPI0010C057E9|nr:S49 family peptidase [Rhizobium sp. FKY42]